MTHDELLERLHIEQGCPVGDALRAVAELHKPDVNNYCSYCNKRLLCEKCGSRLESYVPYPCPTIRAIEKELA